MYKAYVYVGRVRDWDCLVVEAPAYFEDNEEWICAGGINSLEDLFHIMEANDFDAEYFYAYVDHCLSHRLFNMLNKDGNY